MKCSNDSSSEVVSRRRSASCGGCGKCSRCCRRRGPTGTTGPSGPTGASAASIPPGVQAGLTTIPVTEDPFFVTTADLVNHAYPNATYREVVLTFTGETPFVYFPLPVDDDHAYTLIIQNSGDGPIVISTFVGGDQITLETQLPTEVSLEDEIQDNATDTQTYRTEVSFRPSGAYRIPGFSGPTP